MPQLVYSLSQQNRFYKKAAAFVLRAVAKHSPQLAQAVGLHVAAKRYRVAVDPAYASRLSYASQQSLVLQGGPMRPDELKVFLADPYAVAAQRLRDYDEAGKDLDAEVASFDSYTPLLRELIDEAGKL